VRASRTRLSLVVLGAALLVAVALPVQESGCTQTSHLALTRAFADGGARIDRWQTTTCDKAWFEGHFYSVKAPGLAAAALPSYFVLRSLHLLPHSQTTTIWILNLFTVVPALLLLVYLTARLAESVEPRSGLLVAVALGVGSLAFPFGTLWFGHVPAALFGFAAFAVLLRARLGSLDRRYDVAAGALASAAVLFEYPLALVALVLVVYAAFARGVRGAFAYLCGAAIPAAALLAYNAWAFGSVSHFSYQDAVKVTGQTGHDVIGANAEGFFGITWPSPHALAELLISPRGLLTLTPVLAFGALGALALRRSHPLEAAVVAAAVLAFLLYNAGYTANVGGPFGGDSPGPRFLIAVMPFLVFPLGVAARSSPGATAALLGASVASMVLATATVPMVGEGETHRWLDGLRHGDFTHTVVTLLGGGNGWAAILPFALVALGIGAIGVRRAFSSAPLSAHTAFEAASALLAWALAVVASSRLFEPDRRATGSVALGLACVAAGAGVLSWWSRREGAGVRHGTAARPLR
jgi:hypothetical protein